MQQHYLIHVHVCIWYVRVLKFGGCGGYMFCTGVKNEHKVAFNVAVAELAGHVPMFGKGTWLNMEICLSIVWEILKHFKK